MKRYLSFASAILVLCYFVAPIAFADAALPAKIAEPGVQILERGPHHRKVMHVSQTATPQGETVSKTNNYTEIGGGLCRKNEFGQWVDARDLIEIVPGGALASQTAHSVRFAANINTWG